MTIIKDGMNKDCIKIAFFVTGFGYGDSIRVHAIIRELLKEHPKDVDFLALALKLNASIVSKDKELLKQSIIKIFNESNFSELF